MGKKKKNRPCPFEEYDWECEQVGGESESEKPAEDSDVDRGVPGEQLLLLLRLEHLQVARVLLLQPRGELHQVAPSRPHHDL